MHLSSMTKKRLLLTILLFVVYLFVLIKLIILKYPVDFTVTTSFFSFNSNFIPGKTIFRYLSGEPSWRIAVDNLLGNVLLFVPLGIFLPSLWRTITWKGVLTVALGFSAALEISQLFVIGTPDIDDVILNSLGAVLGYGAFVYLVSMVERSNGTHS